MYEVLKRTIKERQISKAQLSRRADITQSDFYMMLAGKRPAFPGWRKRIAAVLEMEEKTLFPECFENVREG